MKINPNWKSRKWFVALVAMAYGIIIHAWPEVGERVSSEQFETLAWIIGGFIFVEGAADVVSRIKGKSKK